MKFSWDAEHPDRMWLDRGDGHAQHVNSADLCDRCQIDLAVAGLEDPVWRELPLCPECSSRLEIEGAIRGIRGDNPYLLDPETEILSADPAWSPEIVPESNPAVDDHFMEYPSDLYPPGPEFYY